MYCLGSYEPRHLPVDQEEEEEEGECADYLSRTFVTILISLSEEGWEEEIWKKEDGRAGGQTEGEKRR